MKMIRSRTVQGGDIVTLMGKRLVRCSKRYKAFGVWEEEHEKTIITLDGERIKIIQPEGVVVKGPVAIRREGVNICQNQQ